MTTTTRTDIAWQSRQLAKDYLEGVRQAAPMAAEQVDVLLRALALVDRPIERFVDLGCGDGFLAAAILERWPNAKGVLIDFSPTMIEAARDKLGRRGEQLRFHELDYTDPAWLDAAAALGPPDAVVSGYSIHHQRDPGKKTIYRQIFDLLAPGGMFINMEHVASATPRIEELFIRQIVDSLYEYQRRDDPTLTPDIVRDRLFESERDEVNYLAMTETQCDWLREMGYAEVDCYFKAFELAVFGGVKPRGATTAQPPSKPWLEIEPVAVPARTLNIAGETITIRSATLDDAASMLASARAVMRDSDNLAYHPEEFTLTVEQERQWIAARLENPCAIVLVAVHGDRVIGCLDFRHDGMRKSAHRGSFGVALQRAWCGKGIGTVMMHMMLDWAAAHPVIEKVGLSVFSTNERAIALYRRLGFTEVGRCPRHYRLGPDKYADNVIMAKFVKPVAGGDSEGGSSGR